MVEQIFLMMSGSFLLAVALLAVLMFANSLIMIPSSEAVCLIFGFYFANSLNELLTGVVVATVANFAGTYPWYLAGRKRTPIVETRRHLPLLRREAFDPVFSWVGRLEQFVGRRGAFGLFVIRLIPLVRSVVSYVVGNQQMSVMKFTFASSFGILLWCGGWIWIGHVFGNISAVAALGLAIVVGTIATLMLIFLDNVLQR